MFLVSWHWRWWKTLSEMGWRIHMTLGVLSGCHRHHWMISWLRWAWKVSAVLHCVLLPAVHWTGILMWNIGMTIMIRRRLRNSGWRSSGVVCFVVLVIAALMIMILKYRRKITMVILNIARYYMLTFGDIAGWAWPFSASFGDAPLILTEVAWAGGVTP